LVLDTGRGSGVPNSAQALDELAANARQVGTAIESVIDGKAEAVRLALIVLLAEGHLLIEDVPGVGKTMLAKALARSIDGSVRRIQFTPDLLPSDVTGVSAYNQELREFEFKPGPIFANIVVGDEINRASPKTQSALLECMEERQVTVDGTTYPLDRPFMVIATQNPVEMEGTYPLPEAQRDRFTARISIGYPTAAAELEMLDTHGSSSPLDQLKPVTAAHDIRTLIEAVRGVLVAGQIKEYIIALCAATRTAPELRLGASPRAALHLLRAARARAALDGRDYVIPDDIQVLAAPVLAHRLLPTAEALVERKLPGQVVTRIVEQTPLPRALPGDATMRGLLGALTVRGRSFVAAGGAALLCGVFIPEPDLVRIGGLLLALPLLSAVGAGRARYRLSCVRTVSPARLPAGQSASLTIRLTNVSRLRTGLLLAEDTVPYALGSRPRFIFEGIGAGGARAYTYQIGSQTRGRYTVGPLRVRVADSFGLVSITRAFTSTSVLTVTPRIIPLARPPLGGFWLGDSEHGRRSIAASGEDDVAPRAYRTGDSLQRVHWRSTARYGELMVRREEQYWRNTASLFLDTRRSGFSVPLFELAVTTAASIGVHLAGEGFEARFVTADGEVPRQGTFRDTLLDTLAVLRPSRAVSLEVGVSALGTAGGQLIAVLGDLPPAQARDLAAARRGTAPGMAIFLAEPDARDVAASAQVLTAAGWRVAVVPDAARLPSAWQELFRAPAGAGGSVSGTARG
jgi:MoxR-like ATPase